MYQNISKSHSSDFIPTLEIGIYVSVLVCVRVCVCVCDGIVSCSQGYNKVMAYSQSSGCTIRSQLRLLGQAIEGRYAPREIIRYISGPWRASMCTINQ